MKKCTYLEPNVKFTSSFSATTGINIFYRYNINRGRFWDLTSCLHNQRVFSNLQVGYNNILKIKYNLKTDPKKKK